MGKVKTKPLSRYTEITLQKALQEVNSGKPVAEISRKYNIPRTTLRYKKNGILKPIIQRRGQKCVLGEETEARLIEWLLYMSDRGCPVTKHQLLNSVQMLLKQMKTKVDVFKKNRPGRHWFDGFRKRHPELCEKLTQNLLYTRASVTEGKIRTWFTEVGNYLKSKNLLDIDPSRVFNCDESSFQLSPKVGYVLVKKDKRTAYTHVKNDDKECVTTLFCGNAAGQLVPPMVMFRYQKIPRNISVAMPGGWGIGHSENGWETAKSFYEWVANVYYPWLMKNKIQFPVILFVDGHVSHLTLALSEFCKEKNIILTALYPNATHILQPMDVAVFRPLKLAWSRIVQEWRMENNGDRVLLPNVANLLKKAVESLDWKPILRNGFRATGLHPFNVDAVNYQKYFKESDTSTPIASSDPEKSTEITPLHSLESNIDDDVLQSFKGIGPDEEWTGDFIHQSLFNVWRKMKTMDQSAASNVDGNDNEKHGDDAEELGVQGSKVHQDNEETVDSILNNENAEGSLIFEITEDGDLILVGDNSKDIIDSAEGDKNSHVTSVTSTSSFDGVNEPQQVIKQTDDKVDTAKVSVNSDADESQAAEENGLNSSAQSSAGSSGINTQTTMPAANQGAHQESAKQLADQLNVKSINEISPTAKNRVPGENQDANDTSTCKVDCPLPNMPSPFKTALVWPKSDGVKTKKGKKMKEKIPSVAVSDEWIKYFEEKDKKKKEEEIRKAAKREERLRIRQNRVRVQELKKKNREEARLAREMKKEKDLEERRKKRERIKEEEKKVKFPKKGEGTSNRRISMKLKTEQSTNDEEQIKEKSPTIAKDIKKELLTTEE